MPLQALRAREGQARLKTFLAESQECLQTTQQAILMLEGLAGDLVLCCGNAPQGLQVAMQTTQQEMCSSMDAISSGIKPFLGILV